MIKCFDFQKESNGYAFTAYNTPGGTFRFCGEDGSESSHHSILSVFYVAMSRLFLVPVGAIRSVVCRIAENGLTASLYFSAESGLSSKTICAETGGNVHGTLQADYESVLTCLQELNHDLKLKP